MGRSRRRSQLCRIHIVVEIRLLWSRTCLKKALLQRFDTFGVSGDCIYSELTFRFRNWEVMKELDEVVKEIEMGIHVMEKSR